MRLILLPEADMGRGKVGYAVLMGWLFFLVIFFGLGANAYFFALAIRARSAIGIICFGTCVFGACFFMYRAWKIWTS